LYRARQKSLNRIVALKMIRAGTFALADDVRRFYTDAENLARLEHPNIVPIYDVGEHAGHHYFTMQFIRGGSLARHVALFKQKEETTARFMAKVARAVDFAHKYGILHRDLKPANILLDAHGTPYVADFGLSKLIEGGPSLTNTGMAIGTPAYMAPGQARGEKTLTYAVDVYGLGTILYELLTGRPPFLGLTVADVLRQVDQEEPRRPRALNPTVHPDLEAICLRCLRKDPAERYRSASAFANDLDRFLAGEVLTGRAATWVERAREWARRRPLLLPLITGLAVAAIFCVAMIVQVIRTDRKDRDQPETSVALQKELDDLTRQRDELKTERAQLKEELNRLKPTLWAFAKGDTFDYLQTFHRELSYSMLNKPVAMSTDTEFVWHWTVEEVDDQDIATIKATLAALRVKTQDAKGQGIIYDSEHLKGQPAKAEYDFFNQLRHSSFRLRIGRNGQVWEVRGFNTLLAKLKGPTRMELMLTSLHLHDDMFAWYLQQSLGLLPPAGVRAKEQWTLPLDRDLSRVGNVKGSAIYGFEDALPVEISDLAKERFHVGGQHSLEFNLKEDKDALRGTLTVDKVEGTIRFDSNKKALDSSNLSLDFKGRLRFGEVDAEGVIAKQTVTWKRQ
jgi:hypothetical protein